LLHAASCRGIGDLFHFQLELGRLKRLDEKHEDVTSLIARQQVPSIGKNSDCEDFPTLQLRGLLLLQEHLAQLAVLLQREELDFAVRESTNKNLLSWK